MPILGEYVVVIIKRFIGIALNTSLCVSTFALFGCNNPSPPTGNPPGAAASTVAPASAATMPNASAYTPPSADQLYQLVAPIALFPDSLLAQVLAGSTYPDQITAADHLLAQNPNLKGGLLQTAVNPQPWDPSVKGLTAFPSVLDQMARNIPWTTALGTAYVNDPTDVMNAIQVMRQRAAKRGALKNTAQQRVTTQTVTTTYLTSDAAYPDVYSGPAVVPPPEQAIEIMPAQPDVVYVPSYDPQTVYGEELPYYPGYTYAEPSYSTGNVVVAGAIGFGTGILIANLFDHHDDRSWGWHSWGMHWGGGGNGGGGGGRGGWQRPAVVHNDNIYVSRSNTVINRYTTNNIVNNGQINSNNRTLQNNTVQSNNVRNIDNHNRIQAPANGVMPPAQAAAAQHGPMTTPNFRNAAMPNMPQAQAERIQALHGAAPNAAPQPRTVPVNRTAATAAQPARFTPAMPNRPRENAMARPIAAPQATGERLPQPPHIVRAQPESNRPANPHPQGFNPPAASRPAEPVRQAAPRPQEFNRPAAPQAAPHQAPQPRQAPPAQHKAEPHPKKDDHEHG